MTPFAYVLTPAPIIMHLHACTRWLPVEIISLNSRKSEDPNWDHLLGPSAMGVHLGSSNMYFPQGYILCVYSFLKFSASTPMREESGKKREPQELFENFVPDAFLHDFRQSKKGPPETLPTVECTSNFLLPLHFCNYKLEVIYSQRQPSLKTDFIRNNHLAKWFVDESQMWSSCAKIAFFMGVWTTSPRHFALCRESSEERWLLVLE